MNRYPLTRYGLRAALVNAVLAVWLCLAPSSTVADPAPSTVVVIGDSLAAGYGLARADAFPTRLEAALRAEGLNVRVVNAGVSGDTSAGGRARLAWTLGSGPVDAVVLELGANDGLRGLAPVATRENLSAMIADLKARDIPVLLAGMQAPPNLGRDYGAEFNAIYPDLSAEHNVLLYPFFLEGVAANPALNQADGIHPNPDGVAAIVERIAPFVKKLIAAD